MQRGRQALESGRPSLWAPHWLTLVFLCDVGSELLREDCLPSGIPGLGRFEARTVCPQKAVITDTSLKIANLLKLALGFEVSSKG